MGKHTATPRSRGTGSGRPLYVEALIRAPLEKVWHLSQDAALHPRWDLRFSRIVPLSTDERGQLRFRYEFRLPLHTIHGTGTSLGTRTRQDGHATSVLKFDTADILSPIGPGAGYWRYQPTPQGVRFITGYNYRPGWGRLGTLLDAPVVRPLLGWATALSFDRLRLWAETGQDPRTSRTRWFLDAGARLAGVGAAVTLATRAARTGTSRRGEMRSARVPARPARARWLALAAGLLAAAAWRTPTPASVPRAGRCLRHAPDALAAQPPSELQTLAEPHGTVPPPATLGPHAVHL